MYSIVRWCVLACGIVEYDYCFLAVDKIVVVLLLLIVVGKMGYRC